MGNGVIGMGNGVDRGASLGIRGMSAVAVAPVPALATSSSTPSMVATPESPAVHAELWPLRFGARVALAWNADFDRRMLEQTAELHGLMLPSTHMDLRHDAGCPYAYARDG